VRDWVSHILGYHKTGFNKKVLKDLKAHVRKRFSPTESAVGLALPSNLKEPLPMKDTYGQRKTIAGRYPCPVPGCTMWSCVGDASHGRTLPLSKHIGKVHGKRITEFKNISEPAWTQLLSRR